MKVKNFRVWVVWRYLIKGQKSTRGGDNPPSSVHTGLNQYLLSYDHSPPWTAENVTLCQYMVLILHGDSEIGAHVRSNFRYLIYCMWCIIMLFAVLSQKYIYWTYLICLWRLIRSRDVTNRFFFLSKNTYFHSCVRHMFWVTI